MLWWSSLKVRPIFSLDEIMTELMKCEVMTSKEIAEVTGKEHKNVMADIRALISQLDDAGRLNFQQSSYVNSQNKEQPMY